MAIYTGNTLDFRFDENNTILDLLCDDGTTIDVWDQTIAFAFDSQQSSLQMTFSPVDASYHVDALCKDGVGNTIPAQPQGNNAVFVISGQPNIGESFSIQLANGTSGQSASQNTRLQTRLVLTIVEPAPDPDLRPPVLTRK